MVSGIERLTSSLEQQVVGLIEARDRRYIQNHPVAPAREEDAVGVEAQFARVAGVRAAADRGLPSAVGIPDVVAPTDDGEVELKTLALEFGGHARHLTAREVRIGIIIEPRAFTEHPVDLELVGDAELHQALGFRGGDEAVALVGGFGVARGGVGFGGCKVAGEVERIPPVHALTARTGSIVGWSWASLQVILEDVVNFHIYYVTGKI